MEALNAKETIQVQSAQVVDVVAEACRTVRELHVPEEALFEAKIRKLATGIRDAKAKMDRV